MTWQEPLGGLSETVAQPITGTDIAALVFAVLAMRYLALWVRDRERGAGRWRPRSHAAPGPRLRCPVERFARRPGAPAHRAPAKQDGRAAALQPRRLTDLRGPLGGIAGLVHAARQAPEQDDAEAVMVDVRDNGVGLDSQSARDLFQPFVRLHGRRYEGHGGQPWAASALNQGACFYFTLPRAT